ncbi:MAG: RDD family protein, partial [Actinomycetes bacterium]
GVTSPPPPPGVPAWAYLAAVLAERRNREMARMQPARSGWGSTPYGAAPPPAPPYGMPPSPPHGGPSTAPPPPPDERPGPFAPPG